MLKGFKQEESLIPLLEYSSKTFIMILRLSQCATRGMTPSAFPSELPSYQPSTNPTSIPSKASTIESSISVSVSPSKIPSENPTSSTYPTISPPCCIEDYFGTYDTYVGWNRKYEIILGPESSSLYEFSDKVGRRYNDFYFRFQREVGSIATPVHLGYNYFPHGCIDVFLIQSPVVIKPQLSVSKVSYYNDNIIGCVPDSSNKVTLLLPFVSTSTPTVTSSSSPSLLPMSSPSSSPTVSSSPSLLATSLPSSYPTVSSSPSENPTSSTYPTISPPCCIEDYFGTYDTYVGWNRKYEIILGPESSSLYEFSDKVGRRYNDFYFRFQREVGSIATPVHLGYNYFPHGCIDVFLIQSPVVIKPQLSVSKVSYYNDNIIGCVPDSSNKVTLLLPFVSTSTPTVTSSSSPSLTPTSTFPPSPNRTVSFCVAHEHGFLFSSLRFFSNCKIVILAVYMYSI